MQLGIAAQTQDCAATEVQGAAADTDMVDLQCGDQNAPDTAEAASIGPDTDTMQEGEGQQIDDGQPDLPGAPLEDAGE